MNASFDPSSLNSSRAKNASHLPSKLDLFNALEKILWFWPDLFIHSAAVSEEQKVGMTLVRSVRLTGIREGFVVFRANPGLGALMAKNLLKADDPELYDEDAFSEFVNIFCGHLMGQLRDKVKASFRHFLPLTMPEDNWPPVPPDLTLLVGVKEHLLEIGLWISPETPPSAESLP